MRDPSTTCSGCRFWSEMIAESVPAGVRAMCLNESSGSFSTYTLGRHRCEHWQDGQLGAIDQPGGDPYASE